MPLITCCRHDHLTPEASSLRDLSFSSEPKTSIADRFDAKAHHLIVEIDDTFAGYARLSSGPQGFFESLIDPPLPFPTGPDVADGSRVTVSPRWRGVELSSLLLLELLFWTHALGYCYLVGSVKTGRRTLDLVHSLGFVDCGQPVVQHYDRINVPSPFVEEVLFQCVMAEPERVLPLLVQKRVDLISRLSAQGYTLHSDCPIPAINQA